MSNIAEEMAKKQREISVAEFFTKNRHLLGFDNPKKALLTTIKEAVDNSLDACEEARILPELLVKVQEVGENRYKVVVDDNGPGIIKAEIPKIFGKLLYGSKFHTLKMSRGQQGIGISAAGMYGQLTTGKPIKITSKISSKGKAHYYELVIDTHKNKPEIIKDEEIAEEKKQGTRVEIELEAKYQKGKQSVDDYLFQTALANPHIKITYISPEGKVREYLRSVKELPVETKEVKPHPHGIELGFLIKMLRISNSRTLKAFLTHEFSRISSKVASDICSKGGLREKVKPSRLTRDDTEKLYQVIKKTKIMNPPTDCISPIGEEAIMESLKKIIEADFYTSCTRAPCVYRGNPFQIEVGLSYGKRRTNKQDEQLNLLKDGEIDKEDEGNDNEKKDDFARLLRFANRVPLLYQQSACAVNKSVVTTAWNNYGLSQSRSSLPAGPVTIMVHIASVWVPFTSESKEAIAHYPEIIKEIKLALQECGRKLGQYLRKKAVALEHHKKKSYIEKYIPHISLALQEILNLSDKEQTTVSANLKHILERGA